MSDADSKKMLEEYRDELRKQLVPVYKELTKLRKQLQPIETKFNDLRMEYRKVDRKLALIDGRMKKLAAGESAKRRKESTPKLSNAQLNQLIDKLSKFVK